VRGDCCTSEMQHQHRVDVAGYTRQGHQVGAAGVLSGVANSGGTVKAISMRVDPRTLAATQLRDFLARQGFDTVTMIRPSQLYTRLAAQGCSMFDVNPAHAQRELEDWLPLLEWLEEA